MVRNKFAEEIAPDSNLVNMNNLLFILTISTCVNGDGFIHHRGAVMSINIQEVGKNQLTRVPRAREVKFLVREGRQGPSHSNLTTAVTRKGQIRKEITEATVRQTLLL